MADRFFTDLDLVCAKRKDLDTSNEVLFIIDGFLEWRARDMRHGPRESFARVEEKNAGKDKR